MDEELTRAAARIKLLALDVDGVLTDGGVYYSKRGEELKRFSARDGHGIGLARAAGIRVAIVTAEASEIVTARARKLGLTDVYLGVKEKGDVIRELRRRYRLDRAECCFVGDDLGDLPALAETGLPVAVADAVAEVRAASRLVTERRGGHGAVREVCDLLLEARAGLSIAQ